MISIFFMIFSSIIYTLLAFTLADLIAGIFHWWEDRYGDPNWPIIGKYIIQPNIKHHLEPTAFCKGNYFQRNWTTFLGTLPFIIGFYIYSQYFLCLAFLIASQSNEIHCWTHTKANKLIRILQKYKILQSPRQHSIHHKVPFDKNFCVMSSYLNSILRRLYFWKILEGSLKLFGIHPKKERSLA